jgi:hypothetical protein
VESEVEDSPLMGRDEIGARGLIARNAPLNERSLSAVNF